MSVDYAVVVERDPVAIADQLLLRANQNRPPVDLDEILESYWNIKTVYTPLRGAGYLLDRRGVSGCILVEKGSTETRRSRFTVAHELGHWILHRFAEKSRDGGPPVRQAGNSELERWCDQFAAGLLMPSTWIQRFAGEFERIGRSDVVLEGPRLFDVSREAFYHRLEQLYRITFAEITPSGRVSFWSRKAPPVDDMTWSRLATYFSSDEWKSARQVPICKGPIRVAVSGRPRWVVLIARE